MTKETTKETATPATPTEGALIVFGLDDARKPHASWFAAADADMAERAAGLMGMQVLKVTTEEHRAAAAGLPAGRLFASGKGFVPFCAAAAYQRLSAFEGAFSPEVPAEPAPVPLPAVTGVPATWADIALGSLVLAADEQPGWYEAIVTEDRSEDLFVLRWRDWLDYDSFVMRRDDLGLLPLTAALP